MYNKEIEWLEHEILELKDHLQYGELDYKEIETTTDEIERLEVLLHNE